MIRKPKEEPQESRLDVRGTLAAILVDSNKERGTVIMDLDTHLDELGQRGYSEAKIEEFRERLNIGGGESS